MGSSECSAKELGALQSLVDDMSRGDQFSHFVQWVASLDQRVEAQLLQRLTAAAKGWVAEFNRSRVSDKPSGGRGALKFGGLVQHA